MSNNGKCSAPFINSGPFRIVAKQAVTPTVTRFEVEARGVATRGQAGQFVIVRIDEKGERIPITLGGTNPEGGTITLFVAEVGVSSKELGSLNVGDSILNLSGPLGNPTEIEHYGDVLCVANGVFIGANQFLVKSLREAGNHVVSAIGARTPDQLFMVEELSECSDELLVADNGEGFGFLKSLLSERHFNHVFTIGSTSLQRYVCELTKPSETPTTVSLFPIMVDGTGMCGACRVTVGGATRFACVDGPDFDGHKIDFDELVSRMRYYTTYEKIAVVLQEKGLK